MWKPAQQLNNLKPHDQRTAVSVRSCAAVQPPEHVGLGSDDLISPALVVNLLRREREKRGQENQQLHNRRHFVCDISVFRSIRAISMTTTTKINIAEQNFELLS